MAGQAPHALFSRLKWPEPSDEKQKLPGSCRTCQQHSYCITVLLRSTA